MIIQYQQSEADFIEMNAEVAREQQKRARKHLGTKLGAMAGTGVATGGLPYSEKNAAKGKMMEKGHELWGIFCGGDS